MRSRCSLLPAPLVLGLAIAGCFPTTEPRVTYTLGGHVRVVGYLTAGDGRFLGTRLEERADGVPVFLTYGTEAVAQTRTVRGEYAFTNLEPGGYTTRAV